MFESFIYWIPPALYIAGSAVYRYWKTHRRSNPSMPELGGETLKLVDNKWPAGYTVQEKEK